MVPASSKHKTYRNVPSCAVAKRALLCAKGLPSKPGYVQGKARNISELASRHGHVACAAAMAAVAAVEAVEVAL